MSNFGQKYYLKAGHRSVRLFMVFLFAAVFAFLKFSDNLRMHVERHHGSHSHTHSFHCLFESQWEWPFVPLGSSKQNGPDSDLLNLAALMFLGSFSKTFAFLKRLSNKIFKATFFIGVGFAKARYFAFLARGPPVFSTQL